MVFFEIFKLKGFKRLKVQCPGAALTAKWYPVLKIGNVF